MMEIPSGGHCSPCKFLYDGASPWDETDMRCALFEDSELQDDPNAIRCAACFSAYPNGATITVTPKDATP